NPDGHSHVEEHHRVVGQPLARRFRQHCSAAEGVDPGVLRQAVGDHLLLQLAEAGLTVLGEDIRDRLARQLFHFGVGVDEFHPQALGQQGSDGALARPRRADDHGTRAHCAHHFSNSARYDSALRLLSANESPPNFSDAASARTRATTDSSTTPARGTAQTSERWWIATAGSFVAVSTVASARGTVEIGFIATRTRSGSPLVMPPSRPPARFERRVTPAGPEPRSISSCACDPHRRAVVKPSPTSTPFIACTPMSAPASRASNRRSQCTWAPSPGGTP